MGGLTTDVNGGQSAAAATRLVASATWEKPGLGKCSALDGTAAFAKFELQVKHPWRVG